MISMKNVNQIWLFLVLTHIAGSLLAGYAQIIPAGSFMVSAAIGFGAGWLISRGKWYGAFAGTLAVPVLVYIICRRLPAGYQASLLLLLMELDLILWLKEKSHVSLLQYCRIRFPRPLQIPAIVLSGCFMYIFCAYFNAWSEIFFHNYVRDSLIAVNQNLPGSLVIFAFMPALVEEVFFRGIFFRGMGGGRTAVVGTSLLFALMHMNFNQFCYAFAAGFVLSILVLITRNLANSMIMHFVFNGISVLVTFMQDHRMIRDILGLHLGSYYPLCPVLYKNGSLAIGSVMIGAVLSAFCLAAIIFLMKQFVEYREEEDEFPGGETWTGPDWRMTAGCVICIAVALSREFL